MVKKWIFDHSWSDPYLDFQTFGHQNLSVHRYLQLHQSVKFGEILPSDL